MKIKMLTVLACFPSLQMVCSHYDFMTFVSSQTERQTESLPLIPHSYNGIINTPSGVKCFKAGAAWTHNHIHIWD